MGRCALLELLLPVIAVADSRVWQVALQCRDACVGDAGIANVKVLEVVQLAEVSKSRVANRRDVEPQVDQVGLVGDSFQVGIGNRQRFEAQHLQSGHVPHQFELFWRWHYSSLVAAAGEKYADDMDEILVPQQISQPGRSRQWSERSPFGNLATRRQVPLIVVQNHRFWT